MPDNPTTALAPAEHPVRTPEKRLESMIYKTLFRGMREPSPNLLTGLSFRLLGQMGRHMFVQMIVRRRKKQVMRYCHVPRFIGDPGFDIEPADENEHLTPIAEKRRNEIRDMMMRGGNLWPNPYTGEVGPWAGDGRTVGYPFAQLMPYLVESSLIYGGAGLRMEAGGDAKRWPVTWMRPYPAPVIRLCAPEYDRQYRTDIRYPAFTILNRDDSVRFELTGDEFAYWCREPNINSDDDEGTGYGVSELEAAVDVLTGLDTSYRYNVTQFTENKLPRGILQLPDVDSGVLEELLNTIEMNVSGPTGGWHSIPYIAVDNDGKQSVQFIPLGDRPGDMQWERFITFSINALCNLYSIAPQEVGFQAFSLNKATLQEADPQTEIIHGEDSGFVPMMVSLEDYLTRAAIGKFDAGAWKGSWKQLGHENEERANKLREGRMLTGYSSQEEERTWGNRAPRRMPLDAGLWQRAQAYVLGMTPGITQDTDQFYQSIEKVYVSQGGTFSIATMVPLSPAMIQVYSTEQQQMQQAAMGGGMPAQPAQEGQQQGAEAPGGQEAPPPDVETASPPPQVPQDRATEGEGAPGDEEYIRKAHGAGARRWVVTEEDLS